MCRAAALVAALALAFAGVVAVPGAARAQVYGETAFEVHRGDGGTVIFVKFWPVVTTLTATVNDPATDESPDCQTTFDAVLTERDGIGGGFGIPCEAKPGDTVTVTDGTKAKTHVVIDIRVTSVDVDGDRVFGTAAEPNSAVTVYTEGTNRSFTADSSGNWVADFSVADPFEWVADIVPGTAGGAEQFDTDADSTVWDWQVSRPEGWQHNPATGHDYLFVGDGRTWADAEAYAVSLGGHLVTINDPAEDAWLVSTFGTQYWIGLNDIAVEGVWVWSSGEPVTYTNWFPGEPSNSDGTEDAAKIENRPPFIAWNDLTPGAADPDAFVVEVVPTLDRLLDDMVADGRLPNRGMAISILVQAEKAPLKALTNHLKDLVQRRVITQLTMDQILGIVAK